MGNRLPGAGIDIPSALAPHNIFDKNVQYADAVGV
jgi:hypothetical protein